MCESEGETKHHLPAITRPVFAACSKKCAFVKPYPPYFKSLRRYGGFAPSCWQNACNAAHDHHSPSQGASAIYNRISAHVPDELNRAELGANSAKGAQCTKFQKFGRKNV